VPPGNRKVISKASKDTCLGMRGPFPSSSFVDVVQPASLRLVDEELLDQAPGALARTNRGWKGTSCENLREFDVPLLPDQKMFPDLPVILEIRPVNCQTDFSQPTESISP
jgi:hypothetical protein